MSELITVASFATNIEAHVFKTRLEAEGIASMIYNEQLINANPLWANTMGGVQIQVNAADAQRATEILQGDTPGE